MINEGKNTTAGVSLQKGVARGLIHVVYKYIIPYESSILAASTTVIE
jgi:hypothetical protein